MNKSIKQLFVFFSVFLLSCGEAEESESKTKQNTVSIPVSLALISNRTKQGKFDNYNIQFDEVIQLNRLALLLSLGGWNCQPNNKNFNNYKVIDIIPKNSPLTILQSFPEEGALSRVLQKVGWIKRPLDSYLKLGRTGPIPFDIVKDQRGVKTAIHSLWTAYPKDTLRKENIKAEKILEKFQKTKQKITLLFESPKEKHKKCGFYGPGPSAGIPKEFFNTVRKMIKETKGFHAFESIQESAKGMSMLVDKKSLAYLIFRSEDLSIKDILFF